MITTKEDIIQYFQKGIKNKDNLKIGVENEKFIFNKSQKRADYQTIIKIFELFLVYSLNSSILWIGREQV